MKTSGSDNKVVYTYIRSFNKVAHINRDGGGGGGGGGVGFKFYNLGENYSDDRNKVKNSPDYSSLNFQLRLLQYTCRLLKQSVTFITHFIYNVTVVEYCLNRNA